MHSKADGAPTPAPRFFSARCRGWTLFELAIVLVVGAALVFVAVRTFRPGEAIALEQAERLRNDLRHVQMLAMTWGQSLRVTAGANSYSIGCVTVSGTPPCDVTPVVDPATRASYLVNLEPGLTLAGPGFTLDIDALGRPRNGAALTAANAVFTITGGGVARTVTVAPLTGFAVAQ